MNNNRKIFIILMYKCFIIIELKFNSTYENGLKQIINQNYWDIFKRSDFPLVHFILLYYHTMYPYLYHDR